MNSRTLVKELQQLGGPAARLALLLLAVLLLARLLAVRAVDGYWGLAVGGLLADAELACYGAALVVLLRRLGTGGAVLGLAAPAAIAAWGAARIILGSESGLVAMLALPEAWAIAAAGAAAGWLWLRMWGRGMPRALSAAALVVLAASLALGASLRMLRGEGASWRTAVLLNAPLEPAAPVQSAADDAASLEPASLYTRSIAAPESRPAASPAGMLLVIAGGLDAASAAAMPHLSSFAEQGLSVPQLQIHADASEDARYALLCGDYPLADHDLLKPRAHALEPAHARVRCAPDVLREAGWRTAYIRAGPAGEHDQDDLLPAAGFADAHFAADDEQAAAAALGQIRALAQQEQQWLLVVHLAGLLAPDSDAERFDQLLAGLLAAAHSASAAPVLVGAVSGAAASAQLDDLTGFAAIAYPGTDAEAAAGLRGQIDIALTLLDFAGLADAAPSMLGHSLLAQAPDASRSIWAGTYWLAPGGLAYRCDPDACRQTRIVHAGSAWQLEEKLLAGERGAQVREQHAQARSLAFRLHAQPASSVLVLIEDGLVLAGTGDSVRNWRIPLRSGGRYEFDVRIANRGRKPVDLLWRAYVGDSNEELDLLRAAPLGTLGPGMTKRIRHVADHGGAAAIGRILLAARPHQEGGEPYRIRFDAAQVRTTSAAGPKDPGACSYALSAEQKNLFAAERIKADQTVDCALHAGSWGASPLYQPGETADLSAQGPWHSRLLLAQDWAMPERWGAWSAGAHPTLQFDLPDLAANAEHELALRLIPYVNPQQFVPEQSLAAYVNGVLAAERTFAQRAEHDWTIRLAPGMLRAHSANAVRIEVGQPFSEGKYEVSSYHEWIGAALLGFSIRRAS